METQESYESFSMNLLVEHKQVQKRRFIFSQLEGTDDNCLARADAVDAVLSINWGKWWNCEQRAQVCAAALAGKAYLSSVHCNPQL